MIPLFFYARKKLKGQIITGFFPALACICFVVDDLVQNGPQQAVNGRDSAQVWAIMDDLMDTIRVTAPRACKSVMERIRAIQ